MRVFFLLVFTGMVLAIEDSATENENVINRGTYPYMAFLYYTDDTIVDVYGARITKAAVLIRQDWLVSSFFETADTPIAFPKKTLLARLGAISIDANFTLNEDENEQEREVIQIARPYKYKADERWSADISLLKTILPFTITPALATVTVISSNSKLFEKSCFILVYARRENTTERVLMKGIVDLLQDTQDICGANFKNDTMLCSVRSDEKSVIFGDPHFCEGNNGGPLICDNELAGIQTYIDDCKQPYLYQSLNAWENLLSCATEEKCAEENCATICVPINKDPPNTIILQELTTELVQVILADGFGNQSITDIFVTPTLTTAESVASESKKLTELTESTHLTVETIYEQVANRTSDLTITKSSSSRTADMIEEVSPKRDDKLEVKSTAFSEDIERKSNVEAHQHRKHSAAPRNIYDNISNFISICLVLIHLT